MCYACLFICSLCLVEGTPPAHALAVKHGAIFLDIFRKHQWSPAFTLKTGRSQRCSRRHSSRQAGPRAHLCVVYEACCCSLRYHCSIRYWTKAFGEEENCWHRRKR
ncbi:hypothetical protein B296_00017639 [Ensete ventricosum]|uniref:Secreted protein n=1 Tax=Ensete ventricosum TaxID=4639 RepID=A0A426Z7K5_ENSVE|nr:hypothetical protein B296_00017639 [Ensete ventricosum]